MTPITKSPPHLAKKHCGEHVRRDGGEMEAGESNVNELRIFLHRSDILVGRVVQVRKVKISKNLSFTTGFQTQDCI